MGNIATTLDVRMDQSSDAVKQLRSARLVQTRHEHLGKEIISMNNHGDPQPIADGDTDRGTARSHEGHQHDEGRDAGGGLNAMAGSATMHCLTGCSLGEIVGLLIGTAAGLATGWTVVLAIGLAFVFGYGLSTLPLLKSGLGFFTALSVVLAADTLSIATMEAVDNLVVALIPGAMNAGLVNVVFWVSMALALVAAFAAAFPVNRWLLARGKGHALTHEYHHGATQATGARRFIPDVSTPALATAVAAFMLGGLVVSTAAELDAGSTSAATVVIGPHMTSGSESEDSEPEDGSGGRI